MEYEALNNDVQTTHGCAMVNGPIHVRKVCQGLTLIIPRILAFSTSSHLTANYHLCDRSRVPFVVVDERVHF